MKKLLNLFSFIVFCLLISQTIRADKPVVEGYFAEWDVYGRNFHVADIPADKLTHIIYAFAKIAPTGEVTLFDPYAATEKSYLGDSWDEPLRGNFKQLQLLKQRYPNLKTSIAIGGWTLSDPFTDAALTQESRSRFATSAVNFMKTYGFDGIDIDWEYPAGGGVANSRPEDKQNFTLLIAEIRNQLNQLEQQTQKKYILTVASAAGDQLNHYELAEVAQYIDWYNLMAYDFHGAWENVTNHQSALYPNSQDPSSKRERYNIEYAVNSYLAAGVPPNKITLGIPLYSRGWVGANGENSGLFQPATDAAQGSWENGIMDYKDLVQRILNSEQYQIFWDNQAKVSWVFSPSQGGGTFYTYDDLRTVNEKVEFIKNKHLRGAMFWEISGDIKNSDNSIIPYVYNLLQQM